MSNRVLHLRQSTLTERGSGTLSRHLFRSSTRRGQTPLQDLAVHGWSGLFRLYLQPPWGWFYGLRRLCTMRVAVTRGKQRMRSRFSRPEFRMTSVQPKRKLKLLKGSSSLFVILLTGSDGASLLTNY